MKKTLRELLIYKIKSDILHYRSGQVIDDDFLEHELRDYLVSVDDKVLDDMQWCIGMDEVAKIDDNGTTRYFGFTDECGSRTDCNKDCSTCEFFGFDEMTEIHQ